MEIVNASRKVAEISTGGWRESGTCRVDIEHCQQMILICRVDHRSFEIIRLEGMKTY